MMDTIQDLEALLSAIDARIEEYDRRLPAHSVKPGMMAEILDLEDQRDQILSKLRRMKEGRKH